VFLLTTEDEVSEAVALKLVEEAGFVDEDLRCIRKGGFGYLKSNVEKYIEASKQCPVLMLTDLDKSTCAPALVAEWTRGMEAPSWFMLRVAVREVESWLLADRDGLSEYLGFSKAKLNKHPEQIDDPKAYLLQVARSAKRELRHGMLPAPGSPARQGFEYNSILCRFVSGVWSTKRAAESSDSLRKTIARLRALRALTNGHNFLC
jgi:hypothetical protein